MDAAASMLFQSACAMAWSALSFCQQGLSPMGARYVYTVIFFLGNLVAWDLRENRKTFFRGQQAGGCKGDRDCLEAEGVLMTSLTSFLFFSAMMLTTMFTRKVHERRSSWHSKWWAPKLVLLGSSFLLCTLVPAYWIQLYGKCAHFGAGLFIFIQLLSVIRYITRLNYRWCITNSEERYLEVILISTLAYTTCIVGTVLMSIWYGGCWTNIIFVATTLLMVYLMPLISKMTKAKGFYMEPGLVGVYIVFLCWSAIRSEPETRCYKKDNAGSHDNWKTMISFAVGLISIAVAAFSTGTDYKCIQFGNTLAGLENDDDDVPYGYGFFHFIFATGSMYFAMLFVGWDTHHTSEKWSIDVGWTSTWVHIANEGLVVISFVSILLARIFGIAWLRQLLERIFGTSQGGGGGLQPTQTEADQAQAQAQAQTMTDPGTGPPPNTTATTSDDTEPPAPPPSPVPYRTACSSSRSRI